MPSERMRKLGKAWAAQRRRRGLANVVHGLPPGQRTVDRKFLERQLFVNNSGGGGRAPNNEKSGGSDSVRDEQEGNNDEHMMSAHIVQLLAQTGAAASIAELAAQNPRAVNSVDRYSGRSAVHFAAAKGQGVALQQLIECKANIDQQDRLGKTALHLAIEVGNSLMVKELVLAKAGLEIRDQAGRSPLLLAILREKRNRTCPGLYTQSVVDYLATVGALSGTADRDGRNSFHYAIAAGDMDMLSTLCAETDNHQRSLCGTSTRSALARTALNAGDSEGVAPLAFAASKGHAEALRALIKARADVNAASSWTGMRPLHWGITRLNMPLCQQLIARKADVRAVTNERGGCLSPLGMAARCGFTDMVQYVLSLIHI